MGKRKEQSRKAWHVAVVRECVARPKKSLGPSSSATSRSWCRRRLDLPDWRWHSEAQAMPTRVARVCLRMTVVAADEIVKCLSRWPPSGTSGGVLATCLIDFSRDVFRVCPFKRMPLLCCLLRTSCLAGARSGCGGRSGERIQEKCTTSALQAQPPAKSEDDAWDSMDEDEPAARP